MISGSMQEHHFKDANGRPDGGQTFGNGFSISWQKGPLGAIATTERKQPNGAFVEDIIKAARGRLQFYQDSEFACEENADALAALELAQEALERRTNKRVIAGTEGTHQR